MKSDIAIRIIRDLITSDKKVFDRLTGCFNVDPVDQKMPYTTLTTLKTVDGDQGQSRHELKCSIMSQYRGEKEILLLMQLLVQRLENKTIRWQDVYEGQTKISKQELHLEKDNVTRRGDLYITILARNFENKEA